MTTYQEIIREEVAAKGRPDINPRHVEAWMRLGHGTLDHLSRDDFAREVAMFAESGMTATEADALAESFGL